MGLLAVSWCPLVCTMSILAQLFLRMFRGVVSVFVPGVNLLSLGSLNEHSTAIFLDLLANDELHGDLLKTRLACS
jgi:hypothetical protein